MKLSRSIIALALAFASPAFAQVSPGTSPLSTAKGGSAAINSGMVCDGNTSRAAANAAALSAAVSAAAGQKPVLISAGTGPCYINAITISTAGTKLFLGVGATLALTSVVSVTGNSAIIQCDNGAGISATTSAAIVNTGTNFKFEGCNVTGPGTGTAGSLNYFVKTSGDGFVLRNNVITNFGTGMGLGIVHILNSSNISVIGNRIQSIASYGIVGYNSQTGYNLTNWLVSDNYIQNSFIIQDTSAGSSTVDGITVTDNYITTGGATTVEFCVDIGNYGNLTSGTIIKNIIVSNNNCQILGGGQHGGFSIANVRNAAITGNIISGNGFGWGIEGIEYTSSTFQGNLQLNATITGNYISADGNQGIICGACSFATISNNVLRNVASLTNSWGIGVISNSGNGLGGGSVSITGNVLDGVNLGTGILVNPQTSGNTISGVTVTGNTILGAGTTTGTGIAFAPGAGASLFSVMEGSNNISNINTGVNFAAGIGAFCHTSDLIVATTPLVGGSGAACH